MHLVSGTEAGIRLYSDEIVSITCSALTSQSWTTKAQAAVTISAIALKLGKIVKLKDLLMKVFENSLWKITKEFLKGNFAHRLNVFILLHEFWDIRDVVYSIVHFVCLFVFVCEHSFLSVLRKLSFPTLPWSVAWCFGQRIGWQDLDWKSMGFDNSLSDSFSFLFLSITITPFHSWQVVKLLSLFQESLLSAVSCVCIKCRYAGYYNMFQLALIWVVIPEELIHIVRHWSHLL